MIKKVETSQGIFIHFKVNWDKAGKEKLKRLQEMDRTSELSYVKNAMFWKYRLFSFEKTKIIFNK